MTKRKRNITLVIVMEYACAKTARVGIVLRGATRQARSGFFAGSLIFDGHVAEFTSFEDFATFSAFDEFDVIFTSHNLHAGMLTHMPFASLVWVMEAKGLES
ncbi:MAG: hypothetical protein JO249_11885 [Acidobacteria bacterium]|nr:hypothetical protein [Acidobacteriota bacterium]